jgi:hypothetical protein
LISVAGKKWKAFTFNQSHLDMLMHKTPVGAAFHADFAGTTIDHHSRIVGL